MCTISAAGVVATWRVRVVAQLKRLLGTHLARQHSVLTDSQNPWSESRYVEIKIVEVDPMDCTLGGLIVSVDRSWTKE